LIDYEPISSRSFELLLDWCEADEISTKLNSEQKFDPDIWVVEVEKNGELVLDSF